MDAIKALFGLPQKDAAKALGISLTALKQVCRKLGVDRWPYWRKKKSKPSRGGGAGGAAAAGPQHAHGSEAEKDGGTHTGRPGGTAHAAHGLEDDTYNLRDSITDGSIWSIM